MGMKYVKVQVHYVHGGTDKPDLGGSLYLVKCELFRVSMKTATIFRVVIMCSLLLVF